MRKLMLSVAATALTATLLSSPLLAWGADGHRMISGAAVAALPADLPAFLRTPQAAEEAAYLGPEKDRERGSGKSFDDENSPGHFVDIEDDLTIGGIPLNALPVSREDYDAKLNQNGTSQYRMGYLPYSIRQGFELLSKDFAYWRVDVWGEKNAKTAEERAWFAKERIFREHIIIHDLGIWSHFVGDASNPMHASVHYNGWGKKYPNPEGFTDAKIHSLFESDYVHGHITEAQLSAAMAAYRDCHCDIAQRTAEYLTASQADIVPVYRAEKDGAFKTATAEGDAMVIKRLAAGAAELRDMIIDAWKKSESMSVGYPEMKVTDIVAGKVDPYENLSY